MSTFAELLAELFALYGSDEGPSVAAVRDVLGRPPRRVGEKDDGILVELEPEHEIASVRISDAKHKNATQLDLTVRSLTRSGFEAVVGKTDGMPPTPDGLTHVIANPTLAGRDVFVRATLRGNAVVTIEFAMQREAKAQRVFVATPPGTSPIAELREGGERFEAQSDEAAHTVVVLRIDANGRLLETHSFGWDAESYLYGATLRCVGPDRFELELDVEHCKGGQMRSVFEFSRSRG